MSVVSPTSVPDASGLASPSQLSLPSFPNTPSLDHFAANPPSQATSSAVRSTASASASGDRETLSPHATVSRRSSQFGSLNSLFASRSGDSRNSSLTGAKPGNDSVPLETSSAGLFESLLTSEWDVVDATRQGSPVGRTGQIGAGGSELGSIIIAPHLCPGSDAIFIDSHVETNQIEDFDIEEELRRLDQEMLEQPGTVESTNSGFGNTLQPAEQSINASLWDGLVDPTLLSIKPSQDLFGERAEPSIPFPFELAEPDPIFLLAEPAGLRMMCENTGAGEFPAITSDIVGDGFLPDALDYAGVESAPHSIYIPRLPEAEFDLGSQTPTTPTRDQPLAKYHKGCLPQHDAARPWVRVNDSSQGKTARTSKINNFHPEEVYAPLGKAPTTWGGIFRYTEDGELIPTRRYTTSEILQYLYTHPLHTDPSTGVRNPHKSRLQLRIQRTPADSSRRYPSHDSSLCRFTNCFAQKNRIRVGEFRVCFDELSRRVPRAPRSRQPRTPVTHCSVTYKCACKTLSAAHTARCNQPATQHDPFFNAGYVHLNCLERLTDFPALVANLNFIAENRTFPVEPDARNRMSLSSGKGHALAAAQEFIASCLGGTVPKTYPRITSFKAGVKPRHEGSLTHTLMLAKMEDETSTLHRTRVKRGDNPGMLHNHLGDLEAILAVRQETKAVRKAKKRARSDDDDMEEVVVVKKLKSTGCGV
ncbi:MAG: hypothetical protein M1833_002003 [Piccolia ochrophora]|nr:MAG: hypothetical protein M1833_002003 [Piccolia ochrophora]